MPLPAFGPVSLGLDLGLGGGPEQLSNNAAPNVASGFTGSFAVGSGADARATYTNPITNSTHHPDQPKGPFNQAGVADLGNSLILGAVALVGVLMFKKVSR
jgi:hypothetical protein